LVFFYIFVIFSLNGGSYDALRYRKGSVVHAVWYQSIAAHVDEHLTYVIIGSEKLDSYRSSRIRDMIVRV